MSWASTKLGIGKPKIRLMNADGTEALSREFYYSANINPKFKPNRIDWNGSDGSFQPYLKGWDFECDIYWPTLTEDEFEELIYMIKHQYDFDSVEVKTKYLELTPRADASWEKVTGFIVSDIDILNEFYYLTHGARIKFVGNQRLASNEFMYFAEPITNLSLSWVGTIQLGVSNVFTVTASPAGNPFIKTWTWEATSQTTQINTDDEPENSNQQSFNWATGTTFTITVTVECETGSYSESFTVSVGQSAT